MGGEGKILYNVMSIRRILVWELGVGWTCKLLFKVMRVTCFGDRRDRNP